MPLAPAWEPASFRDPAGRVFRCDGKLCRSIEAAGAADFDRLTGSGLADGLIRDRRLVPFRPVDLTAAGVARAVEMDELPVVTYPFEWCFDQFRDAARLTLEIMLESLRHDMILKDASAYNLALADGRPIFIDHGSFTAYRDGMVWAGYRQFVTHFYGPLLLASGVDVRELLHLRTALDGLPLDYLARSLPLRARFRLGPLIHIVLHARFQRRYSDTTSTERPSVRPLPRRNLENMLRCLDRDLAALPRPGEATEWADYYGHTNYSEAAFAEKERLVEAVCARLSPHRVVDLGANTGVFSRIAARSARTVIAADIDPAAVNRLYLKQRDGGGGNLVPVWQDFNNPTPDLGIGNRERSSFCRRAGADLALGLALIHHLAIGANWTLKQVADFFADFAPAALVEFVPKSDSQVKRLLRAREDIFPDYRLEGVCDALRGRFRKCEIIDIAGTGRKFLLATERK